MVKINSKKSKKKLPAHPKNYHKPYRLRYFAFFFSGLIIGIFGAYRGGYIAQNDYDVNKVSPSVVKLYHFVCGDLEYQGKIIKKYACHGGTGSGFFISKDGYIATSGHVVSSDVADIMTHELSADPVLYSKISKNSKNIMQKIYSLPEKDLRLTNKQEMTFVAIGNKPLIFDYKNLRQVFTAQESDYIKKAEIIATDYSAKDIAFIENGKNEGFTANDVAILKINVTDAPSLSLAKTENINQNDKITLIGFPTDADNQLTSNDLIQPTVTNGTISSIRNANGVFSRLFQTDADASQGSSGGPAVDESGSAVGIVTYRFKDNNQSNAAKSYLRDIADLKELIKSNRINLQTNSMAQDHWQRGIELSSENKNSKAIDEYNSVLKTFPAHRLVGKYKFDAQNEIKKGNDVKDPPYILFVTIGAIVGGSVMTIISAGLIGSHRVKHHRYKKSVITAKSKKKK